jgi:hypothetical protein
MLNSSNYVRDAAVLNVGEHIAPEVELLPGSKIYYCTIANSVTHMADGAQITFTGGQFMTSNPDIINFLDKLADKPHSPVYTKSNDRYVVAMANAAEDAAMDSGKITSENQGVGNKASSTTVAATLANLKTPQVVQK